MGHCSVQEGLRASGRDQHVRPASVSKVYPKPVMIQVTASFEIPKGVVAVFPQV